MAAIPYPNADEVPGLAEVYQDIAGIGRPVLNLYRVMGHSPQGLRAYIGLSRFVRDQSSLPPHLRELAILQTGLSLGCDYELAHHTIVARQVGIPDAKIDALRQSRRDPFNETERAVLDYAHQVAESRSVSDHTLTELRQHLSLRQVSDLAITVGMYHLCAAVLLSLQVEVDA